MLANHSDFEYCRKIQKHHGKSYYFATLFFPKKMRLATYAFYGFVRVPDEIVDTENHLTLAQKKEKLDQFKKDWITAYTTKTSTDPVLRATSYVFHTYKIPFEYSLSFLDAMIQDTYKERYATYAELEQYMYGSAAVVGLVMSHIIGFTGKNTLHYAQKLGEAMQVTNFLRDIREDFELRNRVYMPQEYLAQFNLTDTDIQNHTCDERFVAFMEFMIKKTRALYTESDTGIPYLGIYGQIPVLIARILYSEILTKIEKHQYNIYTKRVATSFGEKVFLTINGILKYLWKRITRKW